MSGWIKLHRKLKDWEWYDEHKTLVLFIHLLISVNHKDSSWKGVKIPAGSMITGRRSLSNETGLSEQEVRTALSNLQLTNEITIKSTNKYSIISIVCWESYQSLQPAEPQQDNKQSTTNKNDKEVNNIGSAKKPMKRATTISDSFEAKDSHHDLANELGLDIGKETRHFIDHHLAKGTLMKDWNAALRTWLRRAVEFGRSSNQKAHSRKYKGPVV